MQDAVDEVVALAAGAEHADDGDFRTGIDGSDDAAEVADLALERFTEQH